MHVYGEPVEESDISNGKKYGDEDGMCVDELSSKLRDFLAPSLSQEEKDTVNRPKFPLTIFESLINISNISDLIYGGDIVGKENNQATISKKLAMSSGDFLVCPSKEGCTLGVSIRGGGNNNGLRKCDSLSNKPTSKRSIVPNPLKDITSKSISSIGIPASSLVIVAVRILFGNATTEFLPRYLTIMGGRRTELKHGVKR